MAPITSTIAPISSTMVGVMGAMVDVIILPSIFLKREVGDIALKRVYRKDLLIKKWEESETNPCWKLFWREILTRHPFQEDFMRIFFWKKPVSEKVFSEEVLDQNSVDCFERISGFLS